MPFKNKTVNVFAADSGRPSTHVREYTSCDSPNTSRRFALGASNVCLVGENPTCSFPALQGCEGLWSHDYGHA